MTSERRQYFPNTKNSGPFYLQMGLVEQIMGTVQVSIFDTLFHLILLLPNQLVN